MKLIHMEILEFIRCIEGIKWEKLTEEQWKIVKTSIFRAVERGNVQFVTEIYNANRQIGMIRAKDKKGRNIFHVAIECRQINIYNLIYGLREEKRSNLGCTVTSSNENMLHMAGKLSPLSQFNHIQGAYLQMQRELQWFKVESIVPVEMRESLNTSYVTPRELFTKSHEKLMKDAEDSIKGIATSCTVVGALIVTIMFAVAFTVPGGSDSNTGLPVFMDKKLFKIFIISDVISLVTSTTSVIIFLGILTSRYAEDDFLTFLPTKMMIGLSTLFLSISAMMIAFSSALTIMTGDKRNSKTFIRNLLLAFLPISSFIWMQFSFIVEIFISTYGPGIFDKKIKRWH
ncbi:putative ankyrin repeat-containing domain, PGG domain-containing protein [Rosa chinensis]|uniref:Putative ankyrin repeat-containing domain, PGG domain-containing protein n=1 Tax=Rosa chinensis TaxID=74649 RepID=A0A2P6PS52_ROSCH|nr:putative ankyrin repeat-containing domain, PGG domain-containing protein [Rosa chinensis]